MSIRRKVSRRDVLLAAPPRVIKPSSTGPLTENSGSPGFPPRCSNPNPGGRKLEASADVPEMRRLAVLLVDDSGERAVALAETLARGGYQANIERVADPAALARALSQQEWNLVVSRPALSGLTAFDILARLRAASRNVPLVVLADAVQEDEMVALIKAGAEDYVLVTNLSRFLPTLDRTMRKGPEALAPGRIDLLPVAGDSLRQLTEAIGEVFWMTDIEKARMLYVSPAYGDIWGVSCQSLYDSPQSWIDMIHPEDQARVREAAHTRQSVGEYDEEYRIVRPDGTIRWIHDRAYPIRDETGKAYRIVGIAEDITRRKRAEIQSTAFSHLGFRLSSAGTVEEAARIIVDTASELLGWDSCYLHLLTPDHSQIIPVLTVDTIDGTRVAIPSTAFSPEPSPMMMKVMEKGAQLVNRNESEAPPELVPFGDAARRSLSMMYVPIHRGDQVVGVLSIQSYQGRPYSRSDLQLLQSLADHTGGALERINTRDELRQNEEQFRALFELAPMATAIHGADGRYLKANPSYQKMLGYSLDELRRLGIRRLTYPPDIAVGQRLHKELLSGRRDHYQREKRYVRRDGSVVWAQSTALAVRDGDGRLRYIISMVEDFTERKELADQILTGREREQQRLGQDLHDGLCQNLIGIKFQSSLLEKKLQEKSREEAHDARSIASALEKAVQLAYDMARGLQPVLLAREGLACALDELAASTKSLFNVSCAFRTRGVVEIHDQAIVTHLYRIAQECVANAVKHSRGTKLSIVLAAGRTRVLLWISDNGIGLGAHPGKSKGLGLGIMQHRAQMIDASLSIQPRLGGGTRVVCSLPRLAGGDRSVKPS